MLLGGRLDAVEPHPGYRPAGTQAVNTI